jgi:adenosylhomocysteine nucleosidase
MLVDLAISAPCVVFALRRESMYFRRDYPCQQRFPGAPCRAEFRGTQGASAPRSGRTVLMLETGVGAAAMETALQWCLSGPRFGDMLYRPRWLVSVGFSGALQPGQRVGDLVLATEVVDHQGNRWPALHSTPLAGRQMTYGRVLTVPELVGDPREKQQLGQQYQAVAVDMESAAAARLCQVYNVPFACLRVISDDQNTALSPHLVELLRRGRVSLSRLAATVMRHPALIEDLWRMARNTRKAARQLRAVGSLFNAECRMQNAE